MDKLPAEMMTHLLGYLDLNSLLRLRATNKHFRSIVRSYRVTSLSVSANGEDNFGHFFHTNEPIKACQSFVTTNSDFFRSKVMKTLLERIKRLHADEFSGKGGKSNFNVNLNLNHLTSLEVLQIKSLNARKDGHLKLPNLRVLSIDDFNGVCIILETPELFAIKIKRANIRCFQFKFPEQITHLGLDRPGYSNWRYGALPEEFKNLQYVYCKNDMPLHLEYLEDFKELKEVHLFEVSETELCSFLTNALDAVKRIKFFLNGVLVKEPDEIQDFFATDSETTAYQTRMMATYYERLSDRCPWVKAIDYSVLASMFNEIPQDFHRRFFQISSVDVSLPVDQAKFVAFLTKFNAIRTMNLKNVPLDRSFLANLSGYCPYLRDLCINEPSETINLAFVFEQDYLESLTIDQEISFYKMNQILNHFSLDDENRSSQLSYFSFKFRNKTCIVKCDQGFQVSLAGQRASFYDRKAMFNVLKILAKCK